MTLKSCSLATNHKGDYEESWLNAGLNPGAHLQASQYYKDQSMCMTVRNGALAVGTPLVMEPCGSELAVGQLFDELTAVNGNAPDGTLLRVFGENGRKTENVGDLSPYCLASRGGAGQRRRPRAVQQPLGNPGVVPRR